MDRWNRALDLLETQLDGEVDVPALARTALTSEHHFRRMFSALAGMPLSEYVRRRRVTLATAEVLDGASIVDVAIRWGYGSDDAFRRAFRSVHGMTPDEARRPGAVLRSQGQVRFHLRIEGRNDMRHRIVEKPAFRLVGRTARLPIVYEGPNPDLIAFVRGIPDDVTARMVAANDTDPRGVLGVSTGFEEGRADGSLHDHWRVVATEGDVPEGLDALEVPAGLWVVFEGEGPVPEALQRLWADAFGEWFPSNPYRTVPGPEMLAVTYGDDGTTARGELWIPVEREARD
jgi:AraC family transcriptional regulator